MPNPILTAGDDAAGLPVDKQGAIEMMLEAIAKTEFSLADIIHAEAEKIEQAIARHEGGDDDDDDDRDETVDLLEVNKSVERMLRKIIVKEMLLGFQLEDVLELSRPRPRLQEGNSMQMGNDQSGIADPRP